MWDFFAKLLLWLSTTLIVVGGIHSDNSCPEYKRYYCACSLTEIAEVKEIKMCSYKHTGKTDCHPCPEHLQVNVNCNSCEHDICPICSPFSFGEGESLKSHFKQSNIFRFTHRDRILYEGALDFRDFEKEKHHILKDLKDSNNQTVLFDDTFIKLQDFLEKNSLDKQHRNKTTSVNGKTSLDTENRRQNWHDVRLPKQGSSAIHFENVIFHSLNDLNGTDSQTGISDGAFLKSQDLLKTISQDKLHRNENTSVNGKTSLEPKNRRQVWHIVKLPKQGSSTIHLENGMHNILNILSASNNQADMPDYTFLKFQDVLTRILPNKLYRNENTSVNGKTSLEPESRRQIWHFVKLPKQRTSAIHVKNIQQSELMDGNDFKGKSFSIFEDEKIAQPFNLLFGKFNVPKLTLSEKRKELENLNDHLESDIGKVKFNGRRKYTEKDKKKNFLMSDKIKLTPFEKVVNSKHDHFTLLLRPFDTADNRDGIHLNMPDKLKMPKIDKYYIKNLAVDIGVGNIKCSFTNESNKMAINDYAVDLSDLQQINKDVQKCVADKFINAHHAQADLQIFESTCNISLSQTLLFKCMGLEIANETDLRNMKIRKTVKVYATNFTDKIDLIIEVANLSLEQLNNADQLSVYNKTKYKNLNGEVNIQIRFSLKKSSDNLFSQLLGQNIFRQYDLTKEENIKTGSSYVGNKSENNQMHEVWLGNVHLGQVTQDMKSSLSDTEDKKIETLLNTANKGYNEMRFSFLDPLRVDNRDKSSTLRKYHVTPDDASDWQEHAVEEVHDEVKTMDKEPVLLSIEDPPIFTDDIKLPFDTLVTVDLPEAKKVNIFELSEKQDKPKIKISPNSQSNFSQKRMFRDIARSLSPRSPRDTKKSVKIVVTHQSTMQLFPLHKVPGKSENSSDALSFRYRKNVLVSNIDQSLHRKNIKKSDIFKLLNVSTSDLKTSKLYNPKCEICSVVYKTMLDSGLKIDPSLIENNNSSVVVLMSKPEFAVIPHKSKVRARNQNKNKKTTNNTYSYTIQTNINFLFLSSDDYKKLTPKKPRDKTNPLRNSPWADLRRNFVFRVPENFSSQSKILKLIKSLKHNNLTPIFKELLSQDEFAEEEELQRILFALLSKMHEKKPKANAKSFYSTSKISSTVTPKIIKFKKNTAVVNVQRKNVSRINLTEENSSSSDSPVEKFHATFKFMFKQRNKNLSANTDQELPIKRREGNVTRGDFHTPSPVLHPAKIESSDNRGKRQLISPPQNKWCPVGLKRRNGHLKCTIWTFKKLCTLDCHAGYSIDGKGTVEMSCSKNENKWTVDIDTKCTSSTGRESPERPEKSNKGDNTHGDIGSASSLTKNENSHLREKRQLQFSIDIPHNNWCQIGTIRRHGHLTCTLYSFKKTCTIHCHKGYSINGKETVEMSCSKRQNKWTVDVNTKCTGSPIRESPERLKESDRGYIIHRAKRQLDSPVFIPHNHWCPVRAMRRRGHLNCSLWTFKKSCTIHCHAGFSLNGKEIVETSCLRRQGKWTIDVNSPCTADGRASPEKQEEAEKGPATELTSSKPLSNKGKQKAPPKLSAHELMDEDYYEDEYE